MSIPSSDGRKRREPSVSRPQRRHWVDPGCAAGRDVCGHYGRRRKNERNQKECQRVGRRDVVQPAPDEPGQRQRSDHSCAKADQYQYYTLTDNHPKNRSLWRSKRQPDTEFARPPADRVCNESHDARNRDRKRQGGENSKEKGDEPWRCDAFASHLFHGTDESNRLPRVDGMDDRCGFPSDTHRVSAGADQEVDSERGVLSERRIHLVRKFFLESFLDRK